MILNLYKLQKTGNDIKRCKKEAMIQGGVRQGCPRSPYLFNFFTEESVTKMKNKTKAVRINGIGIHCIRFANDIVIIGKSAEEMENMLGTLSEAVEKLKIKINKKEKNGCRE